LIQDITIKNVDNVFNYNFRDGLWQTGQPLTHVVFENLHATDVRKSFNIIGDSSRRLDLTIKNSSFTESDNSEFTSMIFEGRQVEVPAFFNASLFGKLHLENVSLSTNKVKPALSLDQGNAVFLDRVQFVPAHPNAILSGDIAELIVN
jgi:hypothetical protein